jgi:hypothetical protein
MTILREAAQMALDALEEARDAISGWGSYASTYFQVKHNLEGDIDDCEAVIEALRVALAQPEPEPVAWMYDWYDETEDIDGVPIGGIVHDWISKDYDEAHSPTMGCHNIRPLYATPPQREWVGLTDEEIGNIIEASQITLKNYCSEDKQTEYARAIEAKLKEKNT